MEEATAIKSRVVYCWLLTVILLLTNKVAEPYVLWDQFKTELYNDVKYKLCYMSHYQADQEIPEDDVYDYSFWDLNRILVEIGRSLAEFPSISLLQQEWGHRIPNSLL